MKPVIFKIHRGIGEVITDTIPKGITIEIHDYDIGDQEQDTEIDKNGRRFEKFIVEGSKIVEIPTGSGKYDFAPDSKNEQPDPVEIRMDKILKLDKYGCYVGYDGEQLWDCPILANGQPEKIETNGYGAKGKTFKWTQITAPQSQEFLEDVNKKLGTNFESQNFAGR